MEIDSVGRGFPITAVDAVARPSELPAGTLISAVQAANRTELFGHDREVSFIRDNETRKVVIEIKDRESGEVVQQIPLQSLLKMLRRSHISGANS